MRLLKFAEAIKTEFEAEKGTHKLKAEQKKILKESK